MYAERYPEIPASRWAVIANGYDEENFRRVEQGMVARPPGQRPLTLVHSGVLYPSERDPSAFFGALADLKRTGLVSAAQLQIVLRATGQDDYHRRLIETYGVQDLVTLAPVIAYEAALREMLEADGLLLFQGANCDHQIPAKIYEYLRVQRPLLALTNP
jgi:glycosyltransferase involved in cell wall biosynthesis